MQSKIQQSIIIGITATVLMTLLMVLGAMLGMPEMSPPEMLSAIMGISILGGWVIHFLIGITFAAGYVFIFSRLLKKINNKVLKGAVYGIIAFIIAQIGFPVMGAIFGEANIPEPGGSMALLMIGSIVGHIVFGIVVSLMAKPIIIISK